ncbi:MAG: hypothetical protein IPF41_08635 [Flavobacteriales bacterium]|nr:hypothetical protein [Flavobacteriales bacterium]
MRDAHGHRQRKLAWSGPSNFNSTGAEPHRVRPGTYTLVVTGSNGCTSTATAEVEQDTDVPGAQPLAGPSPAATSA